jgi:alkanesulfonate monooxygenase SsuD/methylene tetrahydromethanopterin reductase-like flavin-dependent oxidoreductase (luciferase family)
LSGGRAGWNVVTTGNDHEARNFNRDDNLLHADRYARASEFVDVVTGLWDSWEDDAFVRDKAAGSTSTRQAPCAAPQGRALPGAGAAQCRGRRRAIRSWCRPALPKRARNWPRAAAKLYSRPQQTLDEAVAFYADLKSRLPRHGRTPTISRSCRAYSPVVGSPRPRRGKFEQLQALIDPVVGLTLVSNLTGGFDLSAIRLTARFPICPKPTAPRAVRGW